MKNLIFKNFKWLLVPLVLLTFSVGSVWGTDLTTADLDFGDPAVSYTFEALSTTTNSNTTSSAKTSTSLSGFTPFTNMYLGKNSNGTQSIAIIDGSGDDDDPMTSKYFKMTTTANVSSVSFTRSFQTKGAFSFKIAKTSKVNIGLYNIAASGEAVSHANAGVYLQFTGSVINISAGRTSGTPQKWYSVSSSLPSTDVLEITVIYNNTATATSYGDDISLGAKNAHIFINGTAIMDGSVPKGFYINGNGIGHFRLAYAAAGTSKVDDIKIYDALPDAATPAGCSNYSFHFGTNGQADWSNAGDYCFVNTETSDGNTGYFYILEDFTMPAKPDFYLGWQGSSSDNAKTKTLGFGTIPFDLQRTKTIGTYDGGNTQGAIGILRIRSSYGDDNKYIGFIPGGYVLRLGSGESWTSYAFTAASANYYEPVWTTDIMTLTAGILGGNAYVGLKTASSYVWNSTYSQSNAINGNMGQKSGAGDSWGSNLSSSADVGKRGKFRIWADHTAKNWNLHFVPYHRIVYHSNYPGGGGPADTYSTDVSVEETKSDIALPSAPTAPTGYTFAGWYDAASGGTEKTGNQTISAGASADPEYYAHWYGITLVVKDEDGTTLSGDGKPTLTRSGLSLTATTAGKYVFKDIQITSGTGTLSSTSSTTPTIAAISSDITVTATFYKPIAVTKGTNTGAATFTLSATEVARGGNVTITCAADASHKGNPTITATSGNYSTISVASATSASVNGITGPVTINISYTAKETATVKLHVAGSTSTISGTRYEGDSYTLPSEAAECPDMGLYGWYTTDYEHATTAPSGAKFKLPGASATLVAGDNDFYAVYATIGDLADTYTEITSVGQLVTGDYMIGAGSSGGYCMSNYITSSHMAEQSMSVSDGVVTNSSYSDLIWHITKSGDNYTFYNAAAEKYLALSTASTPVLQTSAHNFTASYSSSSWLFSSTTVSGYQLAYYVATEYFESSTSKGWNIHLFKRDQSISGPYTTSPSCTTHTLTVNMDPVAPDGCSAAAVKTVLGETKTTTATATAGDHFVFSYWTISGTGSTMSNTSDGKSTDNPVTVTMGTDDATLTAHFTEKEKCTVVFKNNGTQLSSTTYWRGENPVAPTLTDGTDHDACDETSDTHYGWTQTAWQNTLEQAAIDAKTAADVKVYAKDATLPAITAGDDGTTITYHAVWAEGSGGTTTISIDGSGLQAVVSSISSGYQSKDFTVGGYTFNASAVTKCTDTGTAQYWFQLKKNNDAITIPTLPGKITNISSTAIRTATSGSVSTGVYFNSSATTSAAIASETLSGATSFSLDVTGNNTSGYLLFGAATCINQLSVTYSTASYSKYLTTCCEYIVDAPTVTGTPTKNSITLSWTNVTGATGYTVTSSGGTPGDVSSDGTARSCVITGLSPNTNYTWSVVATYTTPYCLANTANGNTTTSQVYAVSYNKNGGTIANLPSGGTYAAGEEVTVAAKPDGTVSKGGYTFTGWNTANDGSGEHYDADGTKSFTMPAAPVTLYAEWTTKKNYFIDRMHGNWDGEHTEPTTGYNCYLREGAGYTVPDLSDDDTGSNSCVTGHAHFVGWVASGKIGAQGQLLSEYTIIKGGTVQTVGTDGTIYYAVWAEE